MPPPDEICRSKPTKEAREGHTAELPGARGVGRKKAGQGAIGALNCPESQRNFRLYLLETGHCSTKLSMEAEKTEF